MGDRYLRVKLKICLERICSAWNNRGIQDAGKYIGSGNEKISLITSVCLCKVTI